MIVGNKCDMADKRQVARQKGEEVSLHSVACCCFIVFYTLIINSTTFVPINYYTVYITVVSN